MKYPDSAAGNPIFIEDIGLQLKEKAFRGTKYALFTAGYRKTAAWLAQLDGYQTVVREVEGSSPGRTNTHGLKN